jgi:hypothetical protein
MYQHKTISQQLDHLIELNTKRGREAHDYDAAGDAVNNPAIASGTATLDAIFGPYDFRPFRVLLRFVPTSGSPRHAFDPAPPLPTHTDIRERLVKAEAMFGPEGGRKAGPTPAAGRAGPIKPESSTHLFTYAHMNLRIYSRTHERNHDPCARLSINAHALNRYDHGHPQESRVHGRPLRLL